MLCEIIYRRLAFFIEHTITWQQSYVIVIPMRCITPCTGLNPCLHAPSHRYQNWWVSRIIASHKLRGFVLLGWNSTRYKLFFRTNRIRHRVNMHSKWLRTDAKTDSWTEIKWAFESVSMKIDQRPNDDVANSRCRWNSCRYCLSPC